MVTVVDAANFLTQFQDAETLTEHDLAIGEEDERTISDLLIDQVEFADVIIINKIDLMTAEERAELDAILRKLNPAARILSAERGNEKEWHSPHGDRRQELVFIGQNLPKAEMLTTLQGCLLDDQEMSSSEDQWKMGFSDPFASWYLQEEDHPHDH